MEIPKSQSFYSESNGMTDISYWLMKSEPDVYGIDHLKEEGTTLWDGIRNYQARNFMRSMVIGDRTFFHQNLPASWG